MKYPIVEKFALLKEFLLYDGTLKGFAMDKNIRQAWLSSLFAKEAMELHELDKHRTILDRSLGVIYIRMQAYHYLKLIEKQKQEEFPYTERLNIDDNNVTFTATELALFAYNKDGQDQVLKKCICDYLKVLFSTSDNDIKDFQITFYDRAGKLVGHLEFPREQAHFLYAWLGVYLQKK